MTRTSRTSTASSTFDSDLIPQANTLGHVIGAVHAVHEGQTTPAEIGAALNCVARQGLYYRTAAENLRLIKRQGDSYALTGLGKRLVTAGNDPYRAQRVLREAILKNPALKAIYGELQSRQGKTVEALAAFVARHSDLNASTATRRLSSVVNWLLYAGLAYQQDGRLKAIPVA
jgi:hypothetical protein